MNYSKTIREYCKQNKGKAFDVSYEKFHHFEMVPYKTRLYLKNSYLHVRDKKPILKGL